MRLAHAPVSRACRLPVRPAPRTSRDAALLRFGNAGSEDVAPPRRDGAPCSASEDAEMSGSRVTGHVRLVQRKRGHQWYVKYRLASGRQVQTHLGPRGPARAGPRAGYYTKRMAEEVLHAILTDTRRGTIETHEREAAAVTFADAAAEYLRFVRDVRRRNETTVKDHEGVIAGYLLDELGPLSNCPAARKARVCGHFGRGADRNRTRDVVESGGRAESARLGQVAGRPCRLRVPAAVRAGWRCGPSRVLRRLGFQLLLFLNF